MRVMIVGGGRVSYFLAKRFASKGYEVAIVNRNRDDCEALARSLEKAIVVHGNGTDPGTLEEAGAPATDVFVALTPYDADNLLMCQLADIHFGVPKTLALVNDPNNEAIFHRLGIGTAFSTTNIIATLVEQKVGLDDIVNLIPLEEGRVNITEVKLSPEAPAVGETIASVAMPRDAVIACILRGDEVVIPRGMTTFHANDRVVVISLPNSLGESIKTLTGHQDLER